MLVLGHISGRCGCHDWLHAGLPGSEGDGTVWEYVAVVLHVHSSTLQFCRGQLPLATTAGQPRDPSFSAGLAGVGRGGPGTGGRMT